MAKLGDRGTFCTDFCQTMDEQGFTSLHGWSQAFVWVPCTEGLLKDSYTQMSVAHQEGTSTPPTTQPHKSHWDPYYNTAATQSIAHTTALPYNRSQQDKYVQL